MDERGIKNARLVFIYFIGDKGVNGFKSRSECERALKRQDEYLGLSGDYYLKDRIHKIFVDIKGEK